MKKFINQLSLACISVFFFGSGCLKDELNEDRRTGTDIDNSVRIAEIAGPLSGSKAISLEFSTADTTVNLVVIRIAQAEFLEKDVHVTLVSNPTLVADYNTANGTHYVIPPSSAYSFQSLTVTIPAGTREGYLKMTTKPANLANGEFAFGFSIASVDDPGVKISGNFKNQVVIVGVKNRYDGIYRVTGTMVDLTNATLTGYYPLDWDLVTNGSNQVVAYDRDYTGTPTHIINTPAGLSQYGSFGLIINFDLATNKITSVVNFYGQPAPNGRSAQLDPTGVNAYDPATKTIRIKYNMLQPGTTVRTKFDETWTYLGPR